MALPDLSDATPRSYGRGTGRTIAPAETVARLRPFLAEVGITRIANVTGMDDVGIPVTLVVRPNGRSLSVSQGKGIDLDAARASGLMESIEQFHAEEVRRPLAWASRDELAARAQVADVEALPRLRRRYDPRTRILWCEAIALGSGAAVQVPYELVHLDYTLPLPPGSGYFLGGSNGLASGNHPAEALSHALTELIERDALSLFYRQPAEQPRRRLDLHTVDDPLCRLLLERYERAGIAVAVWEATSDVGVPVFLAAIIDREKNPFRPVGLARGSGCHPDRGIALHRALTEAAQSRLTRITGSRDDLHPSQLAAHRSEPSIALHRAQVLGRAPTPARFDALPTSSAATFEDEIRGLVLRLEAVGLSQVLMVDLSRQQYPVHVLRVIVPGLEGTAENPGYQPGPRARAVGGRS